MDRWRGKWALITGGSSGIGAELARQLAAGGANLLLTARRRDRMEALAAGLREMHGISAEIFVADLAQPNAPAEIFSFTQEKGIAVELLVNNAGFGIYGEFHKHDLARELEMVQVNVTAVVHLTHLFLPQMIERGSGDILIVSSAAGFQGVPSLVNYAATKAFALHFAEGLAEEVRSYGVHVCALCPGSTASEFRQVAGKSGPGGPQETAEKVARVGLKAVAAGKSCVISGAMNWLAVQSQRLAPRAMVPRVAAKLRQLQK